MNQTYKGEDRWHRWWKRWTGEWMIEGVSSGVETRGCWEV